MNPTDPEVTQPPTAPAAPPSDPTDWKAKYEESVRSYNGLKGTLGTRTQERDKALTDLNSLSVQHEGLKADQETAVKTAEQIKTEKEQLQNTQAKTAKELDALKLVSTEFPGLASYFAKGMLVTGDLVGDDLRNFLTNWKTEFEKIGADVSQRRNEGIVPPVPVPTPNQTMTYQEVGDAKIAALRQFGAGSKEYQQYANLEKQMISEGKHK